ncbi:flagellar hook-length control protein FliK [Tepidiphilus olei]|uniref:flagellar hook-length control protein FliK n=1 Tax=Tepidiphilus olei TaxID=2502184 RepID=UPI00115E30D2|nr:flagellar hook-length control protein FliK [Tepidiphilus olei]
MIPPDLAARIRMMVEAELLRPETQVGGVERIRPLPERLPEVLPGQVLRATIQRPLPEGTYQAVVAGREMTLALDQPVKSGDTLELVVERQVGGTIYARRQEGQEGADRSMAGASARTQLSSAGELLRQVLTQPAPQRLPLPAGTERAAPLLPAPPQSPAEVQRLATALQDSVQRSGLFYESHLARWVRGQYPLESLRAEPHNLVARATPAAPSAEAPPGAPASGAAPAAAGAVPPASGAAPAAGTASLAAASAAPGAAGEEVSSAERAALVAAAAPSPLLTWLMRNAPGAAGPGNAERLLTAFLSGQIPASGAEEAAARPAVAPERGAPPAGATAATTASEGAQGAPPASASAIPERLVPIVQHQLDALATQQMNVQFAPWPGLLVQWRIEAEGEQDGRAEGEEGEAPVWRSTLRLTLPRLGEVTAQLQWQHGTLELRLTASQEAALTRMRAAAPMLASALEADGIRVTKIEVAAQEGMDAAGE